MGIRWPVQMLAGDFFTQKLLSSFLPNNRILTIENAIFEEPDIWYEVQLDASFRHSIDFARKLIIGSGHSFEPFSSSKKNRDIAAIYEKLFKKIRNFRKLLLACSEFAIRGESYAYPNFASFPLDVLENGVVLDWICAEEIKHIDRYRIRKYTTEDFDVDYRIYSLKERNWVDLTPDQERALIYFNNSSEEGRFTYGNPLLEAIHVCYYCKKILQQELLNAIERYGQGLLVYKNPPLQEGSDTQTASAVQRQVMDMLAKVKSRHVANIPLGHELQMLTVDLNGVNALQAGIDYYDQQVRMLCLGAELSVTSGSTGSYNQAVTHQETTYHNADYSREVMSEAFTNTLIPLIWEYNEHNWKALGLWDGGEPPRFVLHGKNQMSPKDWAEILPVAMNELKMEISKAEAYTKLEIKPPIKRDKYGQGDAILGEEEPEISQAEQPEESPLPTGLTQQETKDIENTLTQQENKQDAS